MACCSLDCVPNHRAAHHIIRLDFSSVRMFRFNFSQPSIHSDNINYYPFRMNYHNIINIRRRFCFVVVPSMPSKDAVLVFRDRLTKPATWQTLHVKCHCFGSNFILLQQFCSCCVIIFPHFYFLLCFTNPEMHSLTDGKKKNKECLSFRGISIRILLL